MTDLWFLGNADPWSSGGYESPAPPTGSWTWDVQFETTSNQWTYARTSVNSFAEIGGGSAYVFSGIVAYNAVGANGVSTYHPVGANGENGVVDFINDVGVNDVTFGWGIEGDNYCLAGINMEIWVTG
jgi:hypothetical protein